MFAVKMANRFKYHSTVAEGYQGIILYVIYLFYVKGLVINLDLVGFISQ